jgi:hypothetical protein
MNKTVKLLAFLSIFTLSVQISSDNPQIDTTTFWARLTPQSYEVKENGKIKSSGSYTPGYSKILSVVSNIGILTGITGAIFNWKINNPVSKLGLSTFLTSMGISGTITSVAGVVHYKDNLFSRGVSVATLPLFIYMAKKGIDIGRNAAQEYSAQKSDTTQQDGSVQSDQTSEEHA